MDAAVAAYQERKRARGLQPSGVAGQGPGLQQAAPTIPPPQQVAFATQQQHVTTATHPVVADEGDLQGQPKGKHRQGQQRSKRQRQLGFKAPKNGLVQPNQAAVAEGPIRGKDKGGKLGIKRCIPCTMKLHRLTSTQDAKDHCRPVRMSKAHQETCPYCKCDDCKKVFASRQPVDYNMLTLAGYCSRKRPQ